MHMFSALALVLIASGADSAPAAKLDWMAKVYGDGRHNAFTDLALWRGQY